MRELRVFYPINPFRKPRYGAVIMTNTIVLSVLFAATLLPMAWAHYRVSAYRAATRVLIRTLLLGVGAAFGAVVAFIYTQAQGLDQVLIFLSAVGLVHVPAAVIMQLKHLRGIPRA
jgi:hypothetical protein